MDACGGLSWRHGLKWDGTQGPGQQMAAMQVVMSNIVNLTTPPLTNGTGATSVGNVNAGLPIGPADTILLTPPSVRDKVGAALLTTILAVGMMWLFVVRCVPEEWPTQKMKARSDGVQSTQGSD